METYECFCCGADKPSRTAECEYCGQTYYDYGREHDPYHGYPGPEIVYVKIIKDERDIYPFG